MAGVRTLNAYATALIEHRRAFDEFENRLARAADRENIDFGSVRSLLAPLSCTEDDVTVIASALVGLGVLVSRGTGWCVDTQAFAASAGYRKGIRDGLPEEQSSEPAATLLIAPPYSAPLDLQRAMALHGKDLRFAVLDLIASAQSELLLAAPFWDEQTADDLIGPLQGRLEAGVVIYLLARNARSRPVARLRSSLRGASGQCRSFEWFRQSDESVFATSTFHLKALVQDRGVGAYLGSANFTRASMRSRMEIGVRLEGAVAADLSAVLYATLSAAREVS